MTLQELFNTLYHLSPKLKAGAETPVLAFGDPEYEDYYSGAVADIIMVHPRVSSPGQYDRCYGECAKCKDQNKWLPAVEVIEIL